MMYRVIVSFIDLQDGEHAYNVGDAFPREGRTVSEDRIKELSSSNNKRKQPLIELDPKVSAEEPPKEKTQKRKEVESDRSGSSRNVKSKSRKAK